MLEGGMEEWSDTTAENYLITDSNVKRWNLQHEVIESYYYARTKLHYTIDDAIYYTLIEWDVW